MSYSSHAVTLSLAIGMSVAMYVGCGSSAKPGPNGGSGSDAPAGIQEPLVVPSDRLAAGNALNLKDGEQWLEVKIPDGWRAAPRSRDFVAGFYKTQNSTLPQIQVTRAEAYADLSEATSENHEAFKKQVIDKLASASIDAQEAPLMLLLDKRPVVRWVEKGEWKGIPAEIQIVEVIVGGAVYDVKLYVLPGTVKTNRDAGYQVAAGIKQTEDPTAVDLGNPAEPVEDPAKVDSDPAESNEVETKE